MLNYQGVNNMVNVYITMERSTIFHGKIHELNGGSFQFVMLNYQRVNNMVNVYITMERSTIFHGKIHELNGGSFQFIMLVYQRVNNIKQCLRLGVQVKMPSRRLAWPPWWRKLDAPSLQRCSNWWNVPWISITGSGVLPIFGVKRWNMVKHGETWWNMVKHGETSSLPLSTS